MSIDHDPQSKLESANALIAELSPAQIDALTADLLSRREPGHQPLGIFLELARLSTIGTVEIAPIRDVRRNAPPQILLSRRSEHDEHWPGLWHLPGNVVLAMPQTEETIPQPYNVFADGILKKEFKGVERTGDFNLFDAHVRTAARGTELTAFGHVGVDLALEYEEPVGGQFFDFDTVLDQIPPDRLISGHADTLLKAMRSYKRAGQ